jgi:pimeloyl-ACP methyl ester carboxylesterase
VNSGLRYRIGPYRQYVRYARRFCAAGYYVMRFDFPGGGDSTGHFDDYRQYRELFLDNTDFTRTALDALVDESGAERLHLFGLCSGAYNALLTGAADPRVDRMILLSLPTAELGEISDESVSHVRMHLYLRKLFQWRAWVNLLLLRSKFRAMGHTVVNAMRTGATPLRTDVAGWNAVQSYTRRGGEALLAYGDQDPFWQLYQDTWGKELRRLGEGARRVTTHVVPQAGHTFSQIRFQEELIERTLDWLQTEPAAARSGTANRGKG